jgi:hydroxymethylpyrimidine pyrophosphatase-like HAD family hydrolase
MPEFSIATGGSTSIDITRKGITKAYGINRLAELTGIAVADMLYVGDALDEGGNDSVVKATGVPTHPVFGPEETAGLLAALLK